MMNEQELIRHENGVLYRVKTDSSKITYTNIIGIIETKLLVPLTTSERKI